jgi:GMP synthase-like glutamine amidotransferase
MPTSPRLLIIDNSLDSKIYSPVGHWTRFASADFDAVMPPMGEFPHRLDNYSHVIITGSESSILNDDDWILAECDLVREMAALEIPILASCFGQQLVVRALSGKEYVQASETPEFGWVDTFLTLPDGQRDTVMGELPSLFSVFTSHFDEVYPLPSDWTRMAWSEDCGNAAIRWKEGPVWGIQHHPEINYEDGRRLLKALPDMRPDKKALIRKFLHPSRRDSEVTAALVEAFLTNA